MTEFLIQRGRFVQLVKFTVHLNALEALFAQIKELLAVLAFTVTNNRGQQEGPRTLWHGHDPVDHILHLLRLDRLAGRGGIRRANARKKQTHIVIDFSHRPHGRPRVL